MSNGQISLHAAADCREAPVVLSPPITPGARALVFFIVGLVLVATVVTRDFSYCSHYSEYNTLHNLLTHDECRTIDSVFKLLEEITRKEGSGTCRIHIIHLLADHYRSDTVTPPHCHCNGQNELEKYTQTNTDGVTDQRNYCLQYDRFYVELYNQFFSSSHQHQHIPACRTHHSLWSILNRVGTSSLHDNNSCQKDIIYHLKYSFEHHGDPCVCTEASVTSPTIGQHAHVTHGTTSGNASDHCFAKYDSYRALQHLADTDGCLSANSVWHYLDDLQVKDHACRKMIQKSMAAKYQLKMTGCTCSEHTKLHNHPIHRMNNGSLVECSNHRGSTYSDIERVLFTQITSHGCQNHDYLWTELERVTDYKYCTHNSRHCSYVDCTQDLIVRAALSISTDHSDKCSCSKVSTTTTSTTPITTVPSTTTTTKATTTTTTTTKATTTTTTTTKATTPTTSAEASAKTIGITKQTMLVSRFTCDKLGAIEDIANFVHTTHPDSSACKPNDGGSDDAYILSRCNMTSPNMWRKGANVMGYCQSGAQTVPTYVPIATFDGNAYAPLGAQSGIFLGCLSTGTGIKIAIQKCNGVPVIIHIESGGEFVNKANNYYTVV